MNEETTSIEPLPHIEIGETLDDTPLSTVWKGTSVREVFFAFATTTQIFNPVYAGLNEYLLVSRDITATTEAEEFSKTEPSIAQEPREALPRSDAEIANRDRLELLARAYVAGQLSNEEQARLAIVSERVRRLIPRITSADFEQLERIAEDIKRSESEDLERRNRFGQS